MMLRKQRKPRKNHHLGLIQVMVSSRHPLRPLPHSVPAEHSVGVEAQKASPQVLPWRMSAGDHSYCWFRVCGPQASCLTRSISVLLGDMAGAIPAIVEVLILISICFALYPNYHRKGKWMRRRYGADQSGMVAFHFLLRTCPLNNFTLSVTDQANAASR